MVSQLNDRVKIKYEINIFHKYVIIYHYYFESLLTKT